jgi:hypothetical protein
MPANPNWIAGGNIYPATIVTNVGQAEETVVQATSSSVPYVGIAQEGTYYAPGVVGSTTYAAVSGQELRVFQDGEVALCVSDTTITAGQSIKSDSVGFGTPVVSSDSVGVFVVGRAIEGTTGANILFRVMVQPGFVIYTANSHP